MPRTEADDLFAAAPLPVAALSDAQRLACLRLIRSENVGPATFRALINHYGGAGEALAALPEVSRRAGRNRPLRIYSEAAAEAEIEAAAEARVVLLFTIEPGFPPALAFAEGAPPLLYAKGRTELLGRRTVSIVGSRQASAAGIQLARTFAAGIGRAGYVIGSGLARGIDSAAHQSSLETGTIAVLAGGLDVVYPPENRELQAAIGERGVLVSEQPLGFQPRAQDFPRRNRIISGLSMGVVVIEAARRSGTLITARLANQQGREVFAVPGHPLDPRAEGTNQLIKDGATMAVTADDVLEGLSRQRPRPFVDLAEPLVSFDATSPAREEKGFVPLPPAPASPLPAQAACGDHAVEEIRRALGPAPVNFDELARATGLSARSVQIAVMELSLAGLVEFHGGQLVSLKPSA